MIINILFLRMDYLILARPQNNIKNVTSLVNNFALI